MIGGRVMPFVSIVLMMLVGLAGCAGAGASHRPNILTIQGGTPGSTCAGSDRSECIEYQ